MPRPIWIAWETQRRSLTLSAWLGCNLRLFDYAWLEFLRYPWSALRTVGVLYFERPSLVIVQNPSMALATLACFCKRWMKFALVVDRHSNFLFSDHGWRRWKAGLFLAMSRYTLRQADLTLVTNEEIADKVRKASGRSFILPDPYPGLPVAPAPPPRQVPEVAFICSWADDEPVRQAMEACARMRGEIIIHATGKPRLSHFGALKGKPDNFRPTGFLPDERYFRLLTHADAIVVLTTLPSTLVCGAYEGIALGKPLLLSGSKALRDYFHAGAVFLDSHEPEEIARKLRVLLARRVELRKEALAFLETSHAEWQKRRLELEKRLADFGK